MIRKSLILNENTKAAYCRGKNKAKAWAAIFLTAAVLSACSGNTQTSTADYIGIDAAKEAALKDAGLSAQEAEFSAAGLDSKNGTFYYQIIFSSNGTEKEYDIDAITGVVIEKKTLSGSSDTTAPVQESSSAPAAAETSAAAAETAAASTGASADPLSIALSHAGLSQENVVHSRVEEDFDDGMHIFEVEFVSSDGVEYSYDIKADDGTILSFDQDAEFLLPPSSETSGMITEEQAKQAVLERVPGAGSQEISIMLREDDGRMEYEGRLLYDNMMYEFKIDAYSGAIIEWEAENLNFSR